MKNNFLLGLAIAATIFTSCGEDGTSDIVINNYGGGGSNNTEAVFLSGTHTKDLTLDVNKTYKVNGPLTMAAGTTLTIPAGMRIEALAAGSDVYVAIAQGAKIIAKGTKTSPIVFTSDASQKASGDWGGLILLGKAPINVGDTSTSEIGNLPYGGTNAADNSGELEYVRIEYSGGSASASKENNGLSLYGVGNGTKIDYIEVYKGKDDGIEFFGGTVNASHLSVIDMEDDSIDWTEGYTGTITDVYVKHIAKPTETYNSDKAFECDGFNKSNAKGYFSSPTVKNVTIVGVGSGNTFQGGEAIDAGKYEAIRLRVGTEAVFENVKIIGFGEAFDIDDKATGENVVAGKLKAKNVLLEDVTKKVKNDTGVTFTDADFLTEGAATGTDFETWRAGWTK